MKRIVPPTDALSLMAKKKVSLVRVSGSDELSRVANARTKSVARVIKQLLKSDKVETRDEDFYVRL